MQDEKYILDCPKCGTVEGYLPCESEEEDAELETSDEMLDEEEFETEGVPITRVYCPQCGSWIPPDRVRPAD